MTVNLGTNTASDGHAAGDSISGFENLIGGAGNDTLTGDDGANVIDGGAGYDVIDGRGGTDRVSYARTAAVCGPFWRYGRADRVSADKYDSQSDRQRGNGNYADRFCPHHQRHRVIVSGTFQALRNGVWTDVSVTSFEEAEAGNLRFILDSPLAVLTGTLPAS